MPRLIGIHVKHFYDILIRIKCDFIIVNYYIMVHENLARNMRKRTLIVTTDSEDLFASSDQNLKCLFSESLATIEYTCIYK